MINTAVVFDHRGRTKKGQVGPIEVRVTVNRKPYYINTGVRVCANEFRFGAVINRPDTVEMNERLRIVTNKVEREINYCIENGVPVDVAQIRRNILDIGSDTSNRYEVAEWMEERVPMLPIGEGTRKHYYTMLRRLREFGMVKRWSDVTIDNMYRWDAWLHTVKIPLTKAQKLMRMEPKPLSDATINNYHKWLKHLLYLADKMDMIQRNPYELLKGEFKYEEKENFEYLTEDEINAIRNLKLQRGSHLDMVRDLFIMQMFTGMSYSDLMKFDIKNYKKVDGKWVTNADRVKSGVAFVAHLLPPVVEVLEKYGMAVPYITNQVYNRSLKELGKEAGIETRMRTHLGRHTFGTFMLTNKVDIVNLSKMMGHKNIKQTLKYAKTLAESVHDEFDMIEEKMKKKE